MAAPLKTVKLPAVTNVLSSGCWPITLLFLFLFQHLLPAALYDFVFLFVIN